MERLRHEGEKAPSHLRKRPDANALKAYLPRGERVKVLVTRTRAWRGVATPVKASDLAKRHRHRLPDRPHRQNNRRAAAQACHRRWAACRSRTSRRPLIASGSSVLGRLPQ
jgi:hypothetical protein